MNIIPIDTTLSVFYSINNLDEIISKISSKIPEFYERTSQNEVGPTGVQFQAYLFRNKKINIIIRPSRLDVSYAPENSVDSNVILDILKKIDSIQSITINRIALNHAGFIEDSDYKYLNNFKNTINLSSYNIKNELTLRFNSNTILFDTEINDITTFHSGIVTNNATFEKVHALVINKDINTVNDMYKFTNLEDLKNHFDSLLSHFSSEKNTIVELVCGGDQ